MSRGSQPSHLVAGGEAWGGVGQGAIQPRGPTPSLSPSTIDLFLHGPAVALTPNPKLETRNPEN